MSKILDYMDAQEDKMREQLSEVFKEVDGDGYDRQLMGYVAFKLAVRKTVQELERLLLEAKKK